LTAVAATEVKPAAPFTIVATGTNFVSGAQPEYRQSCVE
jgi:hypothetical protein